MPSSPASSPRGGRPVAPAPEVSAIAGTAAGSAAVGGRAGIDGPPDDDRFDPSAPDPARAALDGLAELAGPDDPWAGRFDEVRRVVVARWRRAGRKTRVALVALAVMVAAAIGATAWLRAGSVGAASGDRPVPSLPMATRPQAGAGAGVATGTSGGTAATTTTVRTAVWVAVTGAVHRPGLFRVDADARVAQLVQAAGGLSPEADGDRINLAAPLRDGERVHVPRRGEAVAPPVVAGTGGGPAGGPTPSTPGSGAPAAPGPGGPPASSAGPLDLNVATAEQLDALPGIGPSTAAAIIDHRTRVGPFTSVDELTDVRGIGPAKLEQLRPLVVV